MGTIDIIVGRLCQTSPNELVVTYADRLEIVRKNVKNNQTKNNELDV